MEVHSTGKVLISPEISKEKEVVHVTNGQITAIQVKEDGV